MNLATHVTEALERTPDHVPHVYIGRDEAQQIVTLLQQRADGDPLLADLERHLTPIEYRIVRKLREAGSVVAPDALAEAADVATKSSLWVHIRRLRKKLEAKQLGIEIDTIRGRGYALVEPSCQNEQLND